MLSNELCIFHLYTSTGDYDAQHHLFSSWLLLIRPALTMLLMLPLCLSFFQLIHEALPPLVPMVMLKSSNRRLVTSVEFSKAPSSSYLMRLHGCYSLFNDVRNKWMMHTGYLLDSVGNTQSILVFVHNIVSMEVKPWM